MNNRTESANLLTLLKQIINKINCPEGKRIKDKGGVPQKAKAGVAIVAKATGADVLPVAICCDGKIKAGKQVTVSYGKLIKNSELGLDGENVAPSDI